MNRYVTDALSLFGNTAYRNFLKEVRKQIRKSHLSYYLMLSEQAYDEQFDSQLIWSNKLQAELNKFSRLSFGLKIIHLEDFIRLSGVLKHGSGVVRFITTRA